MCFGDNNAPHAIRLFNAQLKAHWENANDCFTHHGSTLKPEDKYKSSFALAKYYYGKHRDGSQASKSDMMFYASFGSPSLVFVCDHEVILRLVIEEGHYNTNFAKASDQSVADRAHNQSLKQVEIDFRVSFTFSTVASRDSAKIGDGLHTYRVLDLHLLQTDLVTTSAPDAKDALEFYFSDYLKLLYSTGQFISLSLPDIDKEGLRTLIDFSLATSSPNALHIDHVCNMSVDRINEFLTRRWLSLSTQTGTSEVSVSDQLMMSIVEYRSTWLTKHFGIHFHVKFNAPRVAALCSQEVILSLYLEEVSFYQSQDLRGEPHRQYSNWEVAILLTATEVKDAAGKGNGIKLNIQGSRVALNLSLFPGFNESDKEAVRYWDGLIQFILTEYLQILDKAQYNMIYGTVTSDPRAGSPDLVKNDDSMEEGESDDLDDETDLEIWKEAADKGDVQPFDQIIAITQSAINLYFQALWEDTTESKSGSLIRTWEYQEYFRSSFSPVSLRLLSNGSAVVWIQIAEGSLKLLKNKTPSPENNTFNVEKLRVAFEVDVKMCTHADLTDVGTGWQTRFKNSLALKEYSGNNNMTFNYIYLDFKNAQFIPDLSRFGSLTRDKQASSKIQSVYTYIQKYYFTELVASGYHVIHTVPVWKSSTTLVSSALTDVAFHIHSKHSITRQSCTISQPRSSQPLLVILGMNDHPLPNPPRLKTWLDWIMRPVKGTSYSTVNISSTAFLARFLQLLSSVNVHTTIVPNFDGVVDQQWKLELFTWAEHPLRKSRPCPFTPAGAEHGLLKYQWRSGDTWTHAHEGSTPATSGSYVIGCTTTNIIEIPTTYEREMLKIKLTGSVVFHAEFYNSMQRWSSESSVKWEVCFSLRFNSDGLRVIQESSSPVITKAMVKGEAPKAGSIDPEALLREKWQSNAINVDGVLADLKAFEGPYRSCYPGMFAYTLAQPVFTRKGDLLFQVEPSSPHGNPVVTKPNTHTVPAASGTRKNGSAAPNAHNNTAPIHAAVTTSKATYVPPVTFIPDEDPAKQTNPSAQPSALTKTPASRPLQSPAVAPPPINHPRTEPPAAAPSFPVSSRSAAPPAATPPSPNYPRTERPAATPTPSNYPRTEPLAATPPSPNHPRKEPPPSPRPRTQSTQGNVLPPARNQPARPPSSLNAPHPSNRTQ